MKKIFLSLIFLLCVYWGFGQLVPRTMVILEIGTGTWCQYCPGAAIGADMLVANGANVAVIEYHNGDPYANTASNARNSYYNVPGYPNDQFDGPNTCGIGGALCNNGNNYSSYLSMYNQRIAVQSPCLIDISGSNVGNTYNIVLSIKKTAAISGTNLKAHLVLTESDIVTSAPWPNNGQCMTEVDFVERTMVPNELGTSVSFADGDFQVVTLTFTKDPSWVAANCELVAFVQDHDSKVIYNGNKVALAALPAPVSVSFSGTPTSGCAPVTVNYTSTVSSGVNSFQWTLPGGTPSSSSLQNPSVVYSTAGTFNATLTAWNSSTNRGNKMHMPGYLNITAVPGTPVQPTGTSGLCANPPDQNYITLNVPTASSYVWDLQPPTAGVLTPSGVSCLINWDNSFQGSAVLKVKASNSCGDGQWSPPLNITLSPQPGIPGTPSGPTQLCVNPQSTGYTTSGTSPATAYVWELLPSTAGTLTTNWTTATIDWNDTYSGTAQLHVMAVNNGCNGPWSTFLDIHISNGPAQYSVTGGGTYCAIGGTGLPVGLSGSEMNVNYTLFKDGSATTNVVPGTGSVITFGNQTSAGLYTVQGTSTQTSCSMVMNGSAPLTVDPQAPEIPGTPQGPGQTNAGTSSEYITTGGQYASTYSWDVSPSTAGVFSGSTTTATITWNTAFSGMAEVTVTGVNSCGDGMISETKAVTVLPAVGMQDQPKQIRVNISPNPSKDFITLSSPTKCTVDLKVYFTTGNLVLEKNQMIIDKSCILDLTDFPSGLYLFSISSQGLVQTEKIIIE